IRDFHVTGVQTCALPISMDFTIEFLAEHMPKVKAYIPEGTYIMWLDFSGYGISAEEIHDRISNKANVVLEDGKMFGEEGELFQRSEERRVGKERIYRIYA